MGAVDREMTIEEKANALRQKCREIEIDIRDLMNDRTFKGEQTFPAQHGEMKSHIMLAVRHLEDARMRLGKVIQYSGDGVSIFDKA